MSKSRLLLDELRAAHKTAMEIWSVSNIRANLERCIEEVYGQAFKELKEEHMVEAIRNGEANTIEKATKLAEQRTKLELGSKWA